MSVNALIAVLKHSRAKGAEQLVLLRLADLVNEGRDNCAWPGYAHLSKVTGYSRRHVMGCAQNLEARGELRIFRRIGRQNLFFITLGEPLSASTSAVQVTLSHLNNPLKDTLSNPADFSHENFGIADEGENNPLTVPTSAVQVTPPSSPIGGQKEDPRFEAYWQAYPRKGSKPRTRDAWRETLTLHGDAVVPEIMAVLPKAKASQEWKAEDGKFIPSSENFLKKEYWLSSYTPPSVRRVAL